MSMEYYEKLEYEGKHEINGIMAFALKREFSLTRQKIKYNIEITTLQLLKIVPLSLNQLFKGSHHSV